MFQIDLIQELVDFSVFESSHPSYPQLHIIGDSLQCLLMASRKAVEDPEQLWRFLLLQNFKNFVKGIPAVDNDWQPVLLGQLYLPPEGILLLPQMRLVPI